MTLSANNHKFPELEEVELWDAELCSFYDPEEVKDWFKRCIEDKPLHETKYGLWEEWFEKYFSQFRNKEDI